MTEPNIRQRIDVNIVRVGMDVKIIANGLKNLLVKRYAGPFWLRRLWLKKTQWLSATELQEIQLKLLKRLVRHCYQAVPFYREMMDDRGIRAEQMNSLDDIKRFPILTKQDVLKAGSSIQSTKGISFLKTTGLTGGTTGIPLRFQRDLFSVENEHAFVRRQWQWAGIGFRDCTAYLSGRVIVDPDKKEGDLYAYDPFMKELILSTYHLSQKNVPQFIDAVRTYNVKAIVGYPTAVYYFAKCCLDCHADIRLKAALTTSETIDENMKQTIESAFHCRVFDFYGAAERVCYIFMCNRGRYHIIPEYGLTELIPLEEEEYRGYSKIVATGFWNLAMPLIRYDTGDVLKPSDESCDCGREFPVVQSIQGRTGDIIRTVSGKYFAPTLFASISKGSHNILELQIIQDRLDRITVTYVPSKTFDADNRAQFEVHMRKYLPSEIQIDFEQVDAIRRTKSGKTNLVISEV